MRQRTVSSSFAHGVELGRKGVHDGDPLFIFIGLAALLGLLVFGAFVLRRFLRWLLR